MQQLKFVGLNNCELTKAALDVLGREERVEVTFVSPSSWARSDSIAVIRAFGPMPKKRSAARLLDPRHQLDRAMIVDPHNAWASKAHMHLAIWPCEYQDIREKCLLTVPEFARRIYEKRYAA